MATPLMVAQQIFSAFSEGGPLSNPCSNATAANTTVSSLPAGPLAIPTDITSLLSFLLSFSALSNWLKLVVFGTVLETLRRLGFSLYYKISDSFFVSAHFEDGDACYDWMMHWLATQPSWKAARRVHVTSRSFGLSNSGVMIDGEPEDGIDIANGSRPIAYLPTTDSSHVMWFKKHWMRVTRSTKEGGYYGRREEVLDICLLTWDHRLLNTLLIEAKKSYEAAQENMISVYVSDTSNNWRHIASRPKRPLTSIVLDPGIKDLLHDDARDFLKSKSWYAARGIPFRRGYLLYGAPGSGKTSIIHSLAGELGLDVYIISLSRVGLDDTALNEIISELPEKCIALMEDIDAAFSQVMNREGPEDDDEKRHKPKNPDDANKAQPPAPSTSRISLSGLLNALDGVGAQEGRILFATTNKYKSLDPALCRPGRMDIHIEFKLASKYQARELYRCFYLPDSELEKANKEKDQDQDSDEDASDNEDDDDSGYSSVNEKETDKLLSSAASESDTGSLNAAAVNFVGHTHGGRAPKLSPKKIARMAASFAALVPEREFSMAALQGYLMTYKTRPLEAIKDLPTWVAKERAESGKKKQATVTDSVKVEVKDEPSESQSDS